jgi:O-antigen/teichoic acid export membrane protein
MVTLMVIEIIAMFGLTLAIVRFLSRSKSSEHRPGMATNVGFAAASIATISQVIWLAVWLYRPPVHLSDYWMFYALASVGLLSSATAFVSGLTSSGAARLQIVITSLAAGLSCVLTWLISLRMA